MPRIFEVVVVIAVLQIAGVASADIFSFKDTKGFESCLQNTHLVETTRTSTGEQARYLGTLDVQERCVNAAAAYLKKKKKAKKKSQEAAVIGQWIKVAFKNTSNVNAIDLIALQVKQQNRHCNDSAVYDVFLSIMAGRRSDDARSLFQRGKSAIGTCLQGKQFRTDFLEEQDASRGSSQYRNVCEVLKGNKLIKKCLGGK